MPAVNGTYAEGVIEGGLPAGPFYRKFWNLSDRLCTPANLLNRLIGGIETKTHEKNRMGAGKNLCAIQDFDPVLVTWQKRPEGILKARTATLLPTGKKRRRAP